MYSRRTIADFLGDRVVYRNLIPCDRSLPQLADVWQEVGLTMLRAPRKTETVYAAIVYRFLQAAQSQRGAPPLERILMIGDTLMNDGTSARNLGEFLPMRGFIGADRFADTPQTRVEDRLMIGNRWQQLTEFLTWAQAEGFVFDQNTAVLFDLDKTTLGARGRNHQVIDRARVGAIQRTVEELLGGDFDETAFRTVYDRLNRSRYHPFTGDNQDYLAYISLMIVGKVYDTDKFWSELDGQRLTSFKQFVTLCDAQQSGMNDGLLAAHREVTANIAQNDPTPFKSFRYREYDATVALIDTLPDDTPLQEILSKEITLTGEVAQVATQLQERGCLTFGLSDKPDESSVPQGEGLPLHHVPMKVVGRLIA